MPDPLLEVEDLTTQFHTGDGVVSAVDGVSYSVDAGDTVGIVGESGSGKSVSVRSIVRLIEAPGRIESGTVRWKGKNVLTMSDAELRRIRGDEIAMIFQEPREALDPAYTVGYQIIEAIRAHENVSKSVARERAVDLLAEVGIPNPGEAVDRYPHEYSGGMAQRALIAMALACEPEVLICDEPTTALDVTIQAQILELLDEIQEERDLAIMFITHDMGVIAEVADRVNVMYAGEIVETADVEPLFASPKHPYTRGLLASIPGGQTGRRLQTIEGNVPTPNEPAAYCRFAPRCPKAFEECERIHPVSVPVGAEEEERTAACLLYPEGLSKGAAAQHHIDRGANTADATSRPFQDVTNSAEGGANVGGDGR